MKTLKFMLAAATAIGIASVAQAEQDVKASTGFEKLTQTTKVKYGVYDNDADISYFWYAGENEDDNESEIVAFTGDLPVPADGKPGDGRPTGVKNFTGADIGESKNALQVSTGTDPLLRTFNGATGQGPIASSTELTTKKYVDTLVQFTVTPSTDTVYPGKDDKLMIYLKETASTATGDDGVAVVTTETNLVVQAGYLGFNAEGAAVVTPTEYTVVGNVSVKPGKWYRLTVEAVPGIATAEYKSAGFIGFRIYLNDQLLTFDKATYSDVTDGEGDDAPVIAFDFLDENSGYEPDLTNKQMLLSLLTLKASEDVVALNSLSAVGFAGEGLVDDLVVTTTDPSAKVVNFTLTAGDNVTAVFYTIGGNSYNTLNNKVVYDVAENSTIEITSVEYEEGYEYDSYSSTGLTPVSSFNGLTGSFTVTAKEAATLTINAKAKASSGVVPGGEAVVVDTMEAAEALAVSVTSPDETVVSTANYVNYFKKVITEVDGKFSVTAELDETVVDPDATAADLAGKFDEISEAGEVTVAAKPGLYYSVKQGSSLGDMPEGARTMATGGTVNLKATKFPGAGFYQIMVNFTDKQ